MEVEGQESETKRFRIASPDEIYKHKNRISIDSPMVRALIKRRRMARRRSYTGGRHTWYITDIAYRE
ncbi:GreA/GreB family elongation factor [Sodalis sp.]|uniref:GreA/GreB family elongation factor n=1 Tax=Sodalis sp. (in: enterobacteria) TaxID=1898979 RepID=UPI00387321E7